MATQASQSPAHARLGAWALVTGASDGIGRATAQELARLGFNLALTARRKDVLDGLAQELVQTYGISVRVLALDLAKDGAAHALMHWVNSEQGIGEIPGLAVLAAGFGTTGPLDQADIDAEVDMLRVNCEAVLQLSQALGAGMKARGAGQLVLFGSVVGFQGNAMAANYAATKAYVQTLAEGLKMELKTAGVHVLSVAPGPIASGFAARAGMVMGQTGTPESIAKGIGRALGTSGTIRPGFLSKLLGYNMAMTPRPLRIQIMSRIMSGMAQSATASTKN